MRKIAPMLRLRRLTLTQFKNYDRFDTSFTSDVVGISGSNGKGKTNLLDAIYYACFTRSYFSANEALNIQRSTDGFRIVALFERDGEELEVVCVYRPGVRKEISVNGVPYEKFSQHLGRFPVVMIAPDDANIITGGSEGRRKFLDAMMSQVDPEFLQLLIRYNHLLLQRNALLKSWRHQPQEELLNVLNIQMVQPAEVIFQKRKSFLEALIPRVERFYEEISRVNEAVKLSYSSQLQHADMNLLLNEHFQKDMLLQRSTAGIHKDDLLITLDELPFKSHASQGQRKSMLFALKLAEYEMIRHYKKDCILLLDDVFEKLDADRMRNLMNWVCLENEGQVFITDTHPQRLRDAFHHMGITAQEVGL